MSRGLVERQAAWLEWMRSNASDGFYPTAFEHHCGALGLLPNGTAGDSICCPGCRSQIARPEDQCEPLYARRQRRPAVPDDINHRHLFGHPSVDDYVASLEAALGWYLKRSNEDPESSVATDAQAIEDDTAVHIGIDWARHLARCANHPDD